MKTNRHKTSSKISDQSLKEVRVKDVLQRKESGFTTIEIAIVILAASFAIAMAISAYDHWLNKYRIDITEQRIAELEKAVQDFITHPEDPFTVFNPGDPVPPTNGRLPCVARMDLRIAQFDLGDGATGDDYGVETDCGTNGVSGTVNVIGRNDPLLGPMDVHIGFIPVRTLAASYNKMRSINPDAEFQIITDDHAFDGWGRRFTYAVTSIMASDANGYSNNQGAIQVTDTLGAPQTNPPESAIYTIVSHGSNGLGAGNAQTGNNFGCVIGIDPETENCDNSNATFRRSLLFSQTTTANTVLDDFLGFTIKPLISAPTVTEFETYTMDCFALTSQPANPIGSRCATIQFSHNASASGIQISSGEQPSDGQLLYELPSYTPSETGRLVIRATIPVRWTNAWNHPIHGAIYLDDTLIQTGELINPADEGQWSFGGTGVLLGVADGVPGGVPVDIRVYIYDHGPGSSGNSSGWAGSIKLVDHEVDGFLEIMEAGL